MPKETHMLREIREQPAVLKRVRESVSAFLDENPLKSRNLRTVVLTGCGDMEFSGRIAAWMTLLPGQKVKSVSSMEMRWFSGQCTGRDLVIAASASGRTPRTVEAARLARKSGAEVWGITGNPGSMLCDAVDKAIVLDTGPRRELTRHAYAGYHHNVPQTKSFTAALTATLMVLREAGCMERETGSELDCVADLVCGDNLSQLERGADRFIDDRFKSKNASISRVSLLGSGPWKPVVDYGAAKLIEMAIPARSQCLEENNHLEMFLTDEHELMVLLAPDDQSWTRAEELLKPYARLNAMRLMLAPRSLTGCDDLFSQDFHGSALISIPEGNGRGPVNVFGATAALQVLAAALGPAFGRDIDQWVGGVRTGLIEELGQELVRNTRIMS